MTESYLYLLIGVGALIMLYRLIRHRKPKTENRKPTDGTEILFALVNYPKKKINMQVGQLLEYNSLYQRAKIRFQDMKGEHGRRPGDYYVVNVPPKFYKIIPYRPSTFMLLLHRIIYVFTRGKNKYLLEGHSAPVRAKVKERSAA